jgi:ABC-type transporter Mla MlaB component
VVNEAKDSEGFFRKVVRFVANPATDWSHLNRSEDVRHAELEKSELKAMVERKRRNDFVRKREFDTLRKLRRDGLTAEQLAALGGSSRLDDSESRASETHGARAEIGVKAKIDAIEQQMVGDQGAPRSRLGRVSRLENPTEPGMLSRAFPPPAVTIPAVMPAAEADEELLPALPPLPLGNGPAAPVQPALVSPGLPPLAPMHMAARADRSVNGALDIEVSEVMHDPDLDEAVIAFANAEFVQCERALTDLVGETGRRTQHAETWLVLFDLYRATGQQQAFENLAMRYAHQFGWSAPQWFSLPKMVAEAAQAAEDAASPRKARVQGDVGWVCSDTLDIEGVAKLRSQTLQMPLPWVFDWGGLRSIDAEAATQLSALLRQWAKQPVEMRWLQGQCLLDVLHEAAPTGVRDADPAFWLARLDVLRLANRADQFDEVAIDYCVTYEVSPPSWEPARCNLHLSGNGLNTQIPHSTVISELSASFMESGLLDDVNGQGVRAHVELTGQLMGDINPLLQAMNGTLGQAHIVEVSCARLIRVDFIAAGDLLNWVLSKRNEQRNVMLTEAHRLVALFFGAMGISEHAKVLVRKV